MDLTEMSRDSVVLVVRMRESTESGELPNNSITLEIALLQNPLSLSLSNI